MEAALVKTSPSITKSLHFSTSVLPGEIKTHSDAATDLAVMHDKVHWKSLAALNLLWVAKSALIDEI